MKIIEKVKENKNKNKIMAVAIGVAIAGVSYTVGKVAGYEMCSVNMMNGLDKMFKAVPDFRGQYNEAWDKTYNVNNG